jgi:hypothetical protein
LLLLRKGFFLILFSRSEKYWRETHLLDPLVAAAVAAVVAAAAGGGGGR